MRTVTTALILSAGVVNLLPAIGAFSAGRLQSLYGVVIEDPNLAILMRHRAVLFAIVGALLVASAFHPALRPVAFAAGFVSMGSRALASDRDYSRRSKDRWVIVSLACGRRISNGATRRRSP
jgi:hypothetical protein